MKTIQFIAGEVGPGVDQYFALKSELRRFLVFLGSMVSLLVIDSGAFRNALNAAAPGSASSQAENLEEGTIVLAPLLTAIVSASFAQ